MKSILLCIATVKPCRRFLESLPVFLRDTAGDYSIDTKWVWDKKLVDAQNEFAEYFMSGSWDYMLTIEDDHWDFSKEMLDACIKGDSDVVAISYRSRHFPFEVIPMKLNEITSNNSRRFTGMKEKDGYHEADLCGFGFTLIKRHVFEKLDRPYFCLNTDKYIGVGTHATDIDFCARVQEAGMKVIGCFDHRLNHREITEEAYQAMVVDGVIAKHSMFTHIHSLMKGRVHKTSVKEDLCKVQSVQSV